MILKFFVLTLAGLAFMAISNPANATHDGTNDFEISVGLSGTRSPPLSWGRGF